MGRWIVRESREELHRALAAIMKASSKQDRLFADALKGAIVGAPADPEAFG